MRILYITSADFDRTDAPTVRARGLARALAEEGCHVEVLGINGAAHNGAYRYRPVPYPRLQRVGQVTYQFALASRLLDASRFDVVLLRETPFCVQPYFLGRPVYLEVNGLALAEMSGPGRHVAGPLYRWGYRRAAGIFALTPAIRDYLVGLGAPRVHVVTNAVETDRLYPVDRDEARRALDLPLGKQIVFYVGSYHRQHGLESVAKAAESFDGLFLMAGQGDEAFRERAPAGRFRFLGRVDDDTLRTAIGAADVCLNPAAEATAALTNATFPQKLLEYLACARPVISMGDSPAVRAALDGCGVVVPATAEALVEALRRPPTREMGERGRAKVAGLYSYRIVVKQYLEHLR